MGYAVPVNGGVVVVVVVVVVVSAGVVVVPEEVVGVVVGVVEVVVSPLPPLPSYEVVRAVAVCMKHVGRKKEGHK
jgi:hypothetical protein